MRTKIIFLVFFYIFWFMCSGIKFDAAFIIFSVTTPLATFYIVNKLGFIPSQTENFNFLKSIKYFFWLIREIIISSIAVSKISWRKNLSTYQVIEPVISKQNSQLGVVIYANSITLTPGTVTLNVEGNNLLIHALDLKFMQDLQEGIMDAKAQECLKQ